jgi:sulfur carrier protein ThiS
LSKNISDQQPNSASLTIDYPLVEKKMVLQVPAGQTLKEVLKDLKIRPGLSFVILVNGLVVDQQIMINSGDEIRCLPQILGGMI